MCVFCRRLPQQVLLTLTQAGVSREEAYAAVQRNAMLTWETGNDFRSLLAADPAIAAAVDQGQLDAAFDLGRHTRHVDTVFARVFGSA